MRQVTALLPVVKACGSKVEAPSADGRAIDKTLACMTRARGQRHAAGAICRSGICPFVAMAEALFGASFVNTGEER